MYTIRAFRVNISGKFELFRVGIATRFIGAEYPFTYSRVRSLDLHIKSLILTGRRERERGLDILIYYISEICLSRIENQLSAAVLLPLACSFTSLSRNDVGLYKVLLYIISL